MHPDWEGGREGAVARQRKNGGVGSRNLTFAKEGW